MSSGSLLFETFCQNSILNGKKVALHNRKNPLQYKCGSLLRIKTKKEWGDTQLRLLGRELHIQRSVRRGTEAIHVQC